MPPGKKRRLSTQRPRASVDTTDTTDDGTTDDALAADGGAPIDRTAAAPAPSDSASGRPQRTRRPAATLDGVVSDAELNRLRREDPEAFGVRPDELDAVEQEEDRREHLDFDDGPTRGGFSGTARADKGDAALAAWFRTNRPSLACADLVAHHLPHLNLIRHTRVDRDDFSTSARVPTQGEALAILLDTYADATDRDELEAIRQLVLGFDGAGPDAGIGETAISANRVFAHDKPEGELDRQGFEILHMTGRAVGDPTLAPETVRSALGRRKLTMEEWTALRSGAGVAFSPAQHPLNLALGSFAANTFMMAVEGAMTKVEKGFSLETRAFGRFPHIADHLQMTVVHNPTDTRREYYIAGLGTTAPVDAYRHLRADVRGFVESGAFDGTRSFYEYPTMDDVFALRAAEVKSTAPAKRARSEPAVDAIDTPQGRLYANHTPGGGNCFFHALFEAANGRRSDAASQQRVRQAVLEAFVRDPALAQTHFGVDGTRSVAFNDFATEVLTEGTWAGDQTPAYVADAFGMRIVIHRPDGSVYYDAQPNAQLWQGPLPVVHLRYDGAHYDSFTAPRL